MVPGTGMEPGRGRPAASHTTRVAGRARAEYPGPGPGDRDWHGPGRGTVTDSEAGPAADNSVSDYRAIIIGPAVQNF